MKFEAACAILGAWKGRVDSMNIDKFTTKAQEAIREAQQLAETYRHGEVDTLHLVLALVRQEGGVVPSILEKIGVKADLYGEVLDRVLQARPQVEGERPGFSIAACIGWCRALIIPAPFA